MKQELLDRKEEEELERAIQLSLKESQSKTKTSSLASSSAAGASASPFGQLMQTTQSITESYATTSGSSNKQQQQQQRRRVKALYDFEAAEDNEITFKAGDILFLSDDSDPNWWKGFDMNGVEGLFPSNFVTFDLKEKVEVYDPKTNMTKKVSFSENVDVNLIQDVQLGPKKIVIDEKKIDECIEMLQNADPTGEIQPDSQEMLDLEEECYMMGPLIDKKLQDIDEQHAELEDLNLKILEAFQLYNNLMKESINKQTALINSSQIPPMSGMMPGGPSGLNGMAGGINYAAAPPSLEANSLNFANKLNSMAAYAQMSSNSSSNGYTNPNQNSNTANPNMMPGGAGVNPGMNPVGSYPSLNQNMPPHMNMIGGNAMGLANMYPGSQYMGPAMNGGGGLMHNPSQSSMVGPSSSSNLPDLASAAAALGGLPPTTANGQPQMASYGNFN